jgi:excisionase family DNA binding protein
VDSKKRLESGMAEVDLPPMLTPADVAELLRVPRRTVYAWIDSGLLPSRRVGPRLLRILRGDVLELLERGSTEGIADSMVSDWKE